LLIIHLSGARKRRDGERNSDHYVKTNSLSHSLVVHVSAHVVAETQLSLADFPCALMAYTGGVSFLISSLRPSVSRSRSRSLSLCADGVSPSDRLVYDNHYIDIESRPRSAHSITHNLLIPYHRQTTPHTNTQNTPIINSPIHTYWHPSPTTHNHILLSYIIAYIPIFSHMVRIPDVALLESLYAHSTVRMAPNDKQCATITFDTGVAQGSALSPLLILICMNALLGLVTDRGKRLHISHGLRCGVQWHKREVNRTVKTQTLHSRA
jgi:hypothetical protein